MFVAAGSLIFAALLFSIIGTALMRRYAIARNLLDVPNSRSSHLRPVPRGGGLAIVAVFLAAVAVLFHMKLLDSSLSLSLLVGGGVIAAVGFMDDRWRLSARLRLGVHLAAAALVVALLGSVPEQLFANAEIGKACFDVALTLLGLVWATNLFNFMDGIDGIAGSEAVFVAGSGAFMNWMANGEAGLTVGLLCVGAASLGFLTWNWPPAKIFMGDAGSGFLGFALATLALAAMQRGRVSFEVWLILGGVFIVDSSVTLGTRMMSGVQWWCPHRSHAYQHAARRFNSHRHVTIAVLLINLFWLLPWSLAAGRFPHYATAFVVTALGPLAVVAWVTGAGRDA